MKRLLSGLGSIVGFIFVIVYSFGVPFGIYFGFINNNLLALLCSLFVPFFGFIYSIICIVF